MNIFTYGSLMYPEVWQRVVKGNYQQRIASIHGFKRCQVQGEHYPALIEGSETDKVSGILYYNINKMDLKRLDQFEGVEYQRLRVSCQLEKHNLAVKPVDAETYLYSPAYRHRVIDKPWDEQAFAKAGIRHFIQQYAGFTE